MATVKDLKKWLAQFPDNYTTYTDWDGVVGVHVPDDVNDHYTFSTHDRGHSNLGDSIDDR